MHGIAVSNVSPEPSLKSVNSRGLLRNQYQSTVKRQNQGNADQHRSNQRYGWVLECFGRVDSIGARMVTVASYGEWSSPITAWMLARGGVRIGGVALDRGHPYWLEGRPSEGGRNVLVCSDGKGRTSDVLPAPFDVRTRVNEYGGGAFAVADGHVWFVNGADQIIYEAFGGEHPRPITVPGPWRYADLVLDAGRSRLLCVREHHAEDERNTVNTLVAVDLFDGSVRLLAEGHDFYSSPCLNRDGTRIAWLTWDHPDMPWDASTLWVAEINASGGLASTRRVAGGGQESVFQPLFRDDGTLFFVSDPDGWWNLHCWEGAEVRCLAPMHAEFGRPQWQFGMSTYGFDTMGRVVCCFCREGQWRLARLDVDSGRFEEIKTAFIDIEAISVEGNHALIVGGAATRAESVALLDLRSGAVNVLCESTPKTFSDAYISMARSVHFATGDGQHAHAFYYAPCSPDHRAPGGELPPLLVFSHDGPTSATSAALRLGIQFWTSRGFAVLDVNYRGSTGYGRAYRKALEGRWGDVDVTDCIEAARFIVRAGLADGGRLAIRGSSAGGYTTLAALTFHDLFAAGASYYGVGDLESLTLETHNFESHYLDRLIGPYPEARALYVERSPLHSAHRLSCPVIFFQGTEDVIVPPSQAQRMVDALKANGVSVAYLAFEGEQHGFRRSETIESALEAELQFYAGVFGFDAASRPRLLASSPVPRDALPGGSAPSVTEREGWRQRQCRR